MTRRLLPMFALLLLGLTVAFTARTATTTDARGWSQGQVAKGAPRVLQPLPESVTLPLPASLTDTLSERALLVYFSPTCPHCIALQPELNALHERIGDELEIVGVASGSASELLVREYGMFQEVPYRLVHDGDRTIGAAMGARSTPSAALVEKSGDSWKIVDAWYPMHRGQMPLVEMRVKKDPFSVFEKGRYVSNSTCGACHVEEMESWSIQHHSVAWPTLVRMNKHDDQQCNGCHVTGKDQGGWDGDIASPLVNVGCESCHSAGGPHDGERVDPKTTCVGCHDADHSIAFSYEKGLPLIDHFQATGMSDAEFGAARETVFNGELPRELLAFAEGPFVGPETCKSCHVSQHDWWKSDPHGKAMATLQGKEKKDPSCVRCHASPKEAGPPSDKLGDYRVQDSVGCESCHGPGGAHVAAGGGTDNIEGLGESCPVCVLEALCTSCHTQQWDPDWNLEHRLEQIGH